MEEPPKEESIKFAQIAKEIVQMAVVDQDMRIKGLKDPEFWDMSVDKNNTERMKEIIAEIGWPTLSKVGKEASSDAWLLVQHADHDVEFQKYCLSLIKEQTSDEVSKHDIAYLTDRICVNSKVPQIYGTQFNEIDGALVPREIEDVDHVDERRKEMGLGTMEEYTKIMHEKYKEKNEEA